MSKLPMTEADLQACVGGKLPEARRAEVEVYLAARPEEAQRIAAYRRQNEELRALFDAVVDAPTPAHLSSQPRHRSLSLQRYAAVAAFAFISGSVGWMMRSAVKSSAVNVAQTPGGAAAVSATGRYRQPAALGRHCPCGLQPRRAPSGGDRRRPGRLVGDLAV